MGLAGNSNNSTGQHGGSAISAINTKTPTKNVAANVADAVKFSKDKLISKEKLMAKLPSALGKVVIHKSKSDRNEKTSEGGMLASGGLSSVDKTGGSDGLSPGGDSDIETQNLRPPRSSFERENFLSPQSDQIGRKDETNVIKEDRKKSVFEVRKPETTRDRQRQTETDRDRQRQTETDRDRHRETETDRDRQTETDRDRQRQTETDRDRDRDRQRQTDRDRQRQTETETDRYRQRQTETETETDRDRDRGR